MASLPSQKPIQFDRKLAKHLIGDFVFDLEHTRYRSVPFLQRSIHRFLRKHEAALERARDEGLPWLPTDLDPLCPEIRLDKRLEPSFEESEEVNADSLTLTRTKETVFSQPPTFDAVSQLTLRMKAMDPDFEPAARRSVRKLQENQFLDDSVELTVNVVNIRKKLNFSTNRPQFTDGERPRKRPRVEQIKCQCSLTIWDNRSNLEEPDPLVKQHVLSLLRITQTEEYGPCIDIELDRPFKVKASDLKVPVDVRNELTLAIGDNYFMEIKLIPAKTDARPNVLWPPIPVLGKSDGDQNLGLTARAHEKLAGALVARYLHLPQAMESKLPLSVFYLWGGTTLRTKYGLEVQSEWAKPDTEVKQESVEQSWMVDDSDKLFGKKQRAPTKQQPAPKQRRKKTKLRIDPPTPNGNLPNEHVKVTYNFDPSSASAQSLSKEFRGATLLGLQCPICPTFQTTDILELRFHFLSSHHKYNFIVTRQTVDDEGDLREVVFKVEPIPRSKPTQQQDPKEVRWFKPATPFDLVAYLDGDKSWTGGRSKGKGGRRKEHALPPASPGRVAVQTDPMADLRSQNGGFLPSSHVRDFRKPERPKHKPIELQRLYDTKTTSYTSISHRPKNLSEEPMSETDDEIDEEWYVQRHLEHLNVTAREEKWSQMKAELYRRWDRHRLDEKLEHTRFVSDSLVRFVRKNKEWLCQSNRDLSSAWEELLNDLARSRFINAHVRQDVTNMISQARLTMQSVASQDQPQINGTKNTDRPNGRVVPTVVLDDSKRGPTADPRAWKQRIWSQPPFHCGICSEAVRKVLREGIRCSAAACENPTSWFHTKCAGLNKRQPDWICPGCRPVSKPVAEVRDKKGKTRDVQVIARPIAKVKARDQEVIVIDDSD